MKIRECGTADESGRWSEPRGRPINLQTASNLREALWSGLLGRAKIVQWLLRYQQSIHLSPRGAKALAEKNWLWMCRALPLGRKEALHGPRLAMLRPHAFETSSAFAEHVYSLMQVQSLGGIQDVADLRRFAAEFSVAHQSRISNCISK